MLRNPIHLGCPDCVSLFISYPTLAVAPFWFHGVQVLLRQLSFPSGWWRVCTVVGRPDLAGKPWSGKPWCVLYPPPFRGVWAVPELSSGSLVVVYSGRSWGLFGVDCLLPFSPPGFLSTSPGRFPASG